jgi:tetratricopeptide (TPR) repeat protein
VIVTATGDEFLPGKYRVSVDFANARGQLLQGDLSRWNGKIGDQGSFSIRVSEMRTAADQRRFHAIEGGLAMTRRDYAAAMDHYQRLALVDPDDVRGPAGMGAVLLRLGRYSEAATSLERALTLRQGVDSTLREDLAVAYVAMGQDAKAESMLQQHYPGPLVAQILGGARQRLRQLPKQ